jgi:hypothetical protein
MTKSRLAITALAAVAIGCLPYAAEAHRHRGHYILTSQSGASETAGVSVPRSGTYGSSGVAVGTVTAPSVGSYNWPSVGVTNAVPTWSNTNPR